MVNWQELFRVLGIHIGKSIKILQIVSVPGVSLVFVFVHQTGAALGAYRNTVHRIRFDPVFNAALGAFNDKNILIHNFTLIEIKGVL